MEFIQQVQRQVSMTQSNQQSKPSLGSDIEELREQLQNQKNHFERFQQINKNRMYSLEKEVSELREGFLKSQEIIKKLMDKEIVKNTREAHFNRQEKEPSNKPIDRNGVAPSEVQITKIFNCAGKKF